MDRITQIRQMVADGWTVEAADAHLYEKEARRTRQIQQMVALGVSESDAAARVDAENN